MGGAILLLSPVPSWSGRRLISVTKCREIIAVCSQIHTKHINTLCGQNVELYIKIQPVPRSKHSILIVKIY